MQMKERDRSNFQQKARVSGNELKEMWKIHKCISSAKQDIIKQLERKNWEMIEGNNLVGDVMPKKDYMEYDLCS